MTKKILSISFLLGTCWLFAQGQTRKAPIKPVEKEFEIVLGNNTQEYTFIPANKADSFFKLPVYLKDKSGNMIKSTAFDVLYSEWGLFEDSTGREKIMTEYYSMSVVGEAIPEFFRNNIASLAKEGDTLTISRVWGTKKDASNNDKIILEASAKKYILQ